MSEEMTKEMIRCADCMYLVEGKNGEWICSNFEYEEDEKDIHEIPYCEEIGV